MSDKRKIILPNSQLDDAILSALHVLKATNKESSVSVNRTLKSLGESGIGTTHGRVGQRLESLRADGFIGKDKKGYYFLSTKKEKKALKLPRSLESSNRKEKTTSTENLNQ